MGALGGRAFDSQGLMRAALLCLLLWPASARSDDFGWLENGEDPRVRKWVEAQNAAARKTLDGLPGRKALRARLEELLRAGTLAAPVHRGAKVFYLKRSGLQDHPALMVRDDARSAPRVLLDPGAQGASLDWWCPSHDGRLLAYGLSESGTGDSTLRVLEVDSGVVLPDAVPRARHASVAWLADGRSFYYTRYPKPGGVPRGTEQYHRRVYLHRLGDDWLRDEPIFGQARAKEDWPDVSISRDGRWLLVSVSQGWSKTELYFRDLKAQTTHFTTLTAGREAVYHAELGDDWLYLLTNEDAPRYRVLRVDLKKPARKHWIEIVPEGPATLTGMALAGPYLAVEALERATSRLRLHTLKRRHFETLKAEPILEIPLPPLGTLKGFSAQPGSNRLVALYESFFTPPTLYDFDLARSSLTVLEAVPPPADLSEYESKQVSYLSRDKTPVTMFLAHKKRLKRDRKAPVLLTGYGGFGVSMTPSFSPALLAWLERGGVYALPNLRGGGEYGESWHRAGMLERRQNVFDDFLAAAGWLIAQEYTSPEKLAISGSANGGLLVGAALTQAPELFSAAVCASPLLDMLRYHHFGPGRLWIPEYGSPDVPEERGWLSAYSPYHRVRPGVRYPAVLLMSGGNDARVDPMHARKMAAVLQRDSAAGAPALLRLEPEAGGGPGKPLSKTLDELVDRYGFLFWRLGMTGGETE